MFVCVTLYTKRLSLPLNQRIIMTYTTLIFVCVILHFVRETTKYTHKPTLFNSVNTTYFCMHSCARYHHYTQSYITKYPNSYSYTSFKLVKKVIAPICQVDLQRLNLQLSFTLVTLNGPKRFFG